MSERSEPPVKALFAVKGRNAIICAPHPRTQGATGRPVRLRSTRAGKAQACWLSRLARNSSGSR